jgi:hypothetical protein
MTETPAPDSPVTHESLGTHLRGWFTGDIEPRFLLVEGEAQKALDALPVALGSIPKLAATVSALAKLVDPAAGPEVTAVVADAEKVAAEAAQAAEALSAKM